MPKHDLPDGNEDLGNLIDFREYLRGRVDRAALDENLIESRPSAWEVDRHAEHGDGRKPRFSRYDVLWLGMITVIGAMFWMMTYP